MMEQKTLVQRLLGLLSESEKKCRLFLVLNTLLWGALGGVCCLAVWAMLGMAVRWEWLLCAIGYPAVLLGLWGGVIFLYIHTDLKG